MAPDVGLAPLAGSMRILNVDIHVPDPDRGGGWTLAYEHLRAMARCHEVTLVTGGLAPGESRPYLDDLDIEVHGVAWSDRPSPRGVALLADLVRGPGTLRFRTCTPAVAALGETVGHLQRGRSFDLSFVYPGEIAPVIASIEAPTALFLPDCYTVQVRRARRAALPWKQRVIAVLDGLHVERWEHAHYRRAAALAAVSSDDAGALSAITGRPVDVVPLAIGSEWFEPPDRARASDLVSIVAALNYGPNVDGVVWFAEQVWPEVVAQRPGARLRVVGRDPLPEVRAAVAAAGGDLHADVPDTRPYYWEASVIAVPLRLGSGVKTKMLNAFACGAPVVATPIGVEGLDVAAGDIAVAADARGMAEGIADVLANPDRAQRRADRCRAVAERHRAELVAESFEAFLQRAAAGGDR